MSRQINQAGLDLIKRFEGFEARAYLDAVGVPTIGYGHTRTVTERDARDGKRIDEAEAERLLTLDCDSAQADVERYIAVDLNDNQFAALVSFVFNLGGGALRGSTLRRKLNAGDYAAVPPEMARWVRAGGRVLTGLVRRRQAEGELFTTPLEHGEADINALDVARIVTPIGGDDFRPGAYLMDNDLIMERGSVDDNGGMRYSHLNQNVPDAYVSELQTDLKTLGFADNVTVDGAFGKNTREAVLSFQSAAGLPGSGLVDESTRVAMRQWLQQGHTRSDPPSDSPLLLPGLQLINPRVPHFSQGDARWGARTLGRSSSISKQGCAISSIAMVLRFHGRDVNPGSLDQFLDANDGYSGNSVIWSVAGKYGQRANNKLKYQRKTGNEAKLRSLLGERVAANKPTLVRVDYAIDADLTYNHFVVCVGLTDSGQIVMNDPATRLGDGYASPHDNILETTSRKGGYKLVQIEYYDPV
jgi:lysozyme